MEYFDYRSFILNKEKELEEREYDIASLKKFRDSILKTSLDKQMSIGKVLLDRLVQSYSDSFNPSVIATTFIKLGADIESRDIDDNTGLILCASRNYYDAFKIFVRAGANINARNISLSTACILSSERGYEEIVYDLILLGANVNMQRFDGSTALMLAIKAKNYKIVEMLVEDAKADINIKNTKGENALDIAKTISSPDIQALIEYKFNNSKIASPRISYTSDLINEEFETAHVKLKKIINSNL